MPGIGIILNPHSRSNRKNPERIHRLGFIVGDKGSCRQTQDIMDIPTIVHEFKEKHIDILGISGGDGTNHCTLTSFIEEYGDQPLPKIAFLRGGTMNVIANALDIHGSPEQILSNLILKYHEDIPFETIDVNLMKINGKYGFIFGNGVISRFIDIFYKNKGGPLGALAFSVKVFASGIIHGSIAREMMERFNAEVLLDGKPWGAKSFNVIVGSTMESLSFGFKPFYRARSKEGSFQMLGGALTPFQMISQMPKFFFGKKPDSKYLEDNMVSEMDIKTEEPMTWMLDGDMQDATDHINIKIGPKMTIIVR